MKLRSDREGEEFVNNQGCGGKILKYYNTDNSTVLFSDGSILENVSYNSIKNKTVWNGNFKYIFGVACLGVGVFGQHNRLKAYKTWYEMIKRCYNKNPVDKSKSYINCSVCEEWLNFQNFVPWFDSNYNFDYMFGWGLDKDILVKGNKIYSPETCCFVPNEINVLFVHYTKRSGLPLGVCKQGDLFKAQINMNYKKKSLGYHPTPEIAFQIYKKTKEKHINEVAHKWKDKISSNVYEAMCNYKIEITD